MSFHIHHLLPRVSQTCSCTYMTSIRVQRRAFDLLPWKQPPTSVEASMKVNLLPWKLPYKLVEVHLLTWKFPCKLVEVELPPWILMEASMQVHGSFHCRWQLKVPLFPSIAACTNIFSGNFPKLPSTPANFHLLPRISQTSSFFDKTKPHPSLNLKLELLPWTPADFPFSCLVDGSVWRSMLLPEKLELLASLHGSRWKQESTFMEVDKNTEKRYFHGYFHGRKLT